MAQTSKKKKGQLVLGFLVKLVLAILIFGATITLIAQIFFGLVNQEGENFEDFNSDILYVSKEDVGYKMNSLLILDEDSAIVYFEGKEDVEVELNYFSFYDNEKFIIDLPTQCETEGGCLCLLKDLEFIEGGDSEKYLALPESWSISCFEQTEKLMISSCSIGEPELYVYIGYECSNGFIIERNNFDFLKKPYLSLDRRTAFTLENTEEGIMIYPSVIHNYEDNPVKSGSEYIGRTT